MKPLTFHAQLILSLSIGVGLLLCALIFRQALFINAAWIVYGAFYVINPVYPDRFRVNPAAKRHTRIAGVLCMSIGLGVRFGLGF